MSRQDDEQKALNIISGRADQRASVKSGKLGGMEILSLCLWGAAIAMIGAVIAYALLMH